jgi:hypothetical protein
VDDFDAVVTETAFGQGGVDFGLIADEKHCGYILVGLQGGFDTGYDYATAVVAAHDIHCNSHR